MARSILSNLGYQPRRAAVVVATILASIAAIGTSPVVSRADATPKIVPGWMAGLTARTYVPAAGCPAEPVAAGSSTRMPPGRPPIADYPVCADQVLQFGEALDKARRSRRLLLVEFGATWCPSCRGLQHALRDPDLLGGDLESGPLARDLVKISIGLSSLAAGRMVDVDGGHAVLARLLSAQPHARMRAYPMIAVIEPDDTGRVFIRNLDDFVLDGKRSHVASLRSMLEEARDAVRTGRTTTSEPSWIARKLGRFWQRLW